MSRPWWFILGHVMFQSSSDAISAKRETPLFLQQVAESQRRATKRKQDAA